MNWLDKADKYHQTTQDGRYSVCAVSLGGRVRFEAWQTRKHEHGPHCLIVNQPTAEEARRACETDNEVQP